MLKSKLLHPDILSVIGRCGHHAKILIADGNYPASSKIGPRAELVCLQLSPGVPTVGSSAGRHPRRAADRLHQYDGHRSNGSLRQRGRPARLE